MRFALEHQNPFVAQFVTGGSGYPETTYSLASISDPNVVLWSLKPAEEGIGQGLIARVYNLTHQATTATLQLANPITSAQRTTHIETNLAAAALTAGALPLTCTPQQYQTFRLFTSETVNDVPPTVSIVGPSNGARFAAGSNVRIEAVANDADGRVTKVEFFAGATKLGETTAAPHSLTLDALPVGRHRLWLRATDDKGKVVTASAVQVTVTSAPAGTVSVSAASYRRVLLARGSIASVFGTNLATGVLSAPGTPLPTELLGTTVAVKDSLGRARLAPLFYVSPTQINYQIPDGTATGTAQVEIRSPGLPLQTEMVQITQVTPGLFSASADGQGIAAASVTRVRGDGSRSEENVAEYDPVARRFVALPIDLGPATDRVFLILYGTGLRGRNVRAAALVGNVNTPVDYLGAQGQYVGLDQVNLLLPRSLIGRGDVEINLIVQGQAANPLSVKIK
jgi:uncharacterized protein (TIGR03437 family)